MHAQSIYFEQLTALPPQPQIDAFFESVYGGDVVFGDIDGDLDQDVILVGQNSEMVKIAKLYKNDGVGNFTLVENTIFEGVAYGDVAVADIDNDDDLDVLISGQTNAANTFSTKLYTNDGNGNFSLVSNTPFLPLENSSVVFEDFDNDADQDVLFTGKYINGQFLTRLYKNNGNGVFSLVLNTPFIGVHFGSIAFADIDNDFDKDILITGYSTGNQPISKLYENNGLGNYTEFANNHLTSVSRGSVAFADIDNDSDLDLLITGIDSLNQFVSKLYSNPGNGEFIYIPYSIIVGVAYGDIAFGDFDMDNDQDLLITGSTQNQSITRFYSNIGNGQFAVLVGLPFINVSSGSIGVADIDGDNDLEILVSGPGSNGKTNLYLNEGNNVFKVVSDTPFDDMRNCKIATSDINGDNYQDFIISGFSYGKMSTKMYFNNGDETFTDVQNLPFGGLLLSSILLEDFDNDLDKDLLISGRNVAHDYVTQLFINDGLGNFSLPNENPFTDISESTAAFSDTDNDGDLDLFFSSPISKLFINDGHGVFALHNSIPFLISSPTYINTYQSVAFADVDGDNDQDAMVKIGQSLKLYLNNGTGNFQQWANFGFSGDEVAFADIDNDGDQDFAVGLSTSNSTIVTRIFKNNGLGYFLPQSVNQIIGTRYGTIDFVDIDNDWDEDLMITGAMLDNPNTPISSLYKNDGQGNFSLVLNQPFVNVYNSDVAFFDFNNDFYPDVLIAGQSKNSSSNTKLYKNVFCNFDEIVPNVVNLPTVISACQLDSIPAPTAVDNCIGTIVGSANVSFPIAELGTTNILWTYNNDYGYTFSQQQIIQINLDNQAPIPNVVNLPSLISTCSISELIPPTASDNCSGTIVGVTNALLPITSVGTTVITWTYEDENGNSSTQFQNVEITPSAVPTPNMAVLPTIYANCQIDSIVPPTANFNCIGTILGVPDIVFPIIDTGLTQIVWTFNDGNGNTSSQIQNVEISLMTAPIPDVSLLETIYSACPIYSLVPPTASFNCLETIVGTPNISFPITTQGQTTITWTYDDGAGNSTNQTQNVFYYDSLAPVPLYEELPDILASCEVTFLNPPPAFDNCSGTVYGTTNFQLPIAIQGNYVINWTYVDEVGNVSSQQQNITIEHSQIPVLDNNFLPTFEEVCEIVSMPIPTATLGCNQTIFGVPNVSFPIKNGPITITWSFDGGGGNIVYQNQIVKIIDTVPPVPVITQLSLDPIYLDCDALETIMPPTAIDDCFGLIYGSTTTTFPIVRTMGINWKFTDGNGNSTYQYQLVSNPNESSSEAQIIQINGNTLKAVDSGYSYQWVICNSTFTPVPGATSQTFTVTENNSYAVFISQLNCEVVYAISNCIDIYVAGLEEVSCSTIQVFPNPTSNDITITSESMMKSIKLRDINGKLLENLPFLGNQSKVQLEKYSNGIYLLEVLTDEGTIIEKIIKSN